MVRLTFVLRVRFCTDPLFNTRSNSKLPFWLTGENVSIARCEFLILLADPGCGNETAPGNSCLPDRMGIALGFELSCCIDRESSTMANYVLLFEVPDASFSAIMYSVDLRVAPACAGCVSSGRIYARCSSHNLNSDVQLCEMR